MPDKASLKKTRKRPTNPDSLVKESPKTKIELEEEELKDVSGGTSLNYSSIKYDYK